MGVRCDYYWKKAAIFVIERNHECGGTSLNQMWQVERKIIDIHQNVFNKLGLV